MSQIQTVESINASYKLLNIGKAWINEKMNEAGTSPKLTIRLDQDLGINIKISANTEILLFDNEKRTTVNPETGKPFQDADYRVAIPLPAVAVDAEIARKQALKEANVTA